MTCECGKNQAFKDCCGRFLDGSTNPTTCEELVRSRFVAFGFGNFDYIEQTQVDPLPAEVRERRVPEWESLEIISTEDGGPEDDIGVVKFEAVYKEGTRRLHRETSRFVRVDGEWRYEDGDIQDTPAPGKNKVGRNHPCPCGSGRKFKRCCGV
ncbi:MAG: SEC-C domain-containing protein [Candidatus Eremiobacteraeota bacterium]|nr:SEC-C domain-containing protein [Candidatus Eremiobacteraeota bacterium]